MRTIPYACIVYLSALAHVCIRVGILPAGLIPKTTQNYKPLWVPNPKIPIEFRDKPNPYPWIFSGNTLGYPWVPTLNFNPWVSWVTALIFYSWVIWVPVLSF